MVFHAMLDHPVTSKLTKINRLSISQVGSGWIRFGHIRSNHVGYQGSY